MCGSLVSAGKCITVIEMAGDFMSQGENPSNDQTNAGASEPVAEPVKEPVPAENAAAPVAEETPLLARQLAELETKLAEAQDAFLRAKADAENTRRRAQEDISKAHKFAVESFAEAVLPVRDSLEMALKIETPSIELLKEGVEMTLKQLSSAFERNRLVEINPQAGEKLDPMKHQAISMVAAEQEANTIVSVLQKGYMISDRLLRPALVTVSQ
ncbi:MAG: nucleotide exchange factor GrpE [Oxalobacteraceae bacterium]|jgi:molecular chaperone GrpE|nr:nucleotide exchange factor GrpE [Oxalobacteraceae bacterium]